MHSLIKIVQCSTKPALLEVKPSLILGFISGNIPTSVLCRHDSHELTWPNLCASAPRLVKSSDKICYLMLGLSVCTTHLQPIGEIICNFIANKFTVDWLTLANRNHFWKHSSVPSWLIVQLRTTDDFTMDIPRNFLEIFRTLFQHFLNRFQPPYWIQV